MKVQLNEGQGHVELSLTPESLEDQLKLLRLSRNAKPDGVFVRCFLFPKEMQTDIVFNLYKDTANCISNQERRRT